MSSRKCSSILVKDVSAAYRMQPTDGMVRGMPAEDLGGPITIPVGKVRLDA